MSQEGNGIVELDKVKAAVLEEAGKEAERVLAEARAKSDHEFEHARRELEHDHKARLSHVHHELTEQAAVAAQRARTEKAKELLAAKNEVIGRVFDAAMAKLSALPGDRYKALLVEWLVEIGPEEKGRVCFTRKDRETIAEEVVRLANEKLESRPFTLSDETIQAAGGFLFRAQTYELDRTFDAQIRTMRREMVPEIASQLFSERD
jgi:V/A-type H+-transporting ATPase subunit E